MPNLDFDSDTCGSLYQEEDLLAQPLRFEQGFAYAPEGPGLGIELDPDAFERAARRSRRRERRKRRPRTFSHGFARNSGPVVPPRGPRPMAERPGSAVARTGNSGLDVQDASNPASAGQTPFTGNARPETTGSANPFSLIPSGVESSPTHPSGPTRLRP